MNFNMKIANLLAENIHGFIEFVYKYQEKKEQHYFKYR